MVRRSGPQRCTAVVATVTGEGWILAGITEITDTTFADAVFKSATPVLVEFWAPWAKACALAEPLLLGAAERLPEDVRLVRCNVEENPMAATVYGIRNIPMVILFRQGEELDQWAGSLPTDEIVDRVRAACGGGSGTEAETEK